MSGCGKTYRALSELLFSGEDHTAATGATLALRRLDGSGIRVVEWTAGGNFILAVSRYYIFYKYPRFYYIMKE